MQSTIIIPAAKKATRGNVIIIPTAARRAAVLAAPAPAPAPAAAPAAPAAPAAQTVKGAAARRAAALAAAAPAAAPAAAVRPVMVGHYNLSGAAREVYRHLYRAGIAGKVAQIAAEKIGSEPTPERLQLFLCRPRLWADPLRINFAALLNGNYTQARAEMEA